MKSIIYKLILISLLGVSMISISAQAGSTKGSPKMDWKKPAPAELKKMLTPIQFDVTQKEGTERPFKNEFWNNEQAGLYVDIVSGEPLFTSNDKFDSGTGWPSFTKPIDDKFVTLKTDHGLF